MTTCCSSYANRAGEQFDARRADADLARYRKRGPDPTTRILLGGIRAARPALTSLLDVGAGVGVISHELVGTTAASAVVVDASAAYLKAAQAEAERRGSAASYAFHEGDFVELAPTVGEAAAVTLDRVICCYPAFGPLLEAALAHARQIFAYSYPRDRWFVRVGMALENTVRRLRRNSFRIFVHPPRVMQAEIEERGFRLVTRQTTFVWCAEVWERRGGP